MLYSEKLQTLGEKITELIEEVCTGAWSFCGCGLLTSFCNSLRNWEDKVMLRLHSS